MSRMQYLPGCWMVEAALNAGKYDVIDEAHPCWLHLNYVHHDSAQWLATTPLLPNNVRDALAGESTRPREPSR